MGPWNILLRLWAILSVSSLAIDGGCLWLDRHGAVAAGLLESYDVNHVTIFLWSAPAPFVLAVFLLPLGASITVLRWALAHGAQWVRLHQGPMHGLR